MPEYNAGEYLHNSVLRNAFLKMDTMKDKTDIVMIKVKNVSE